MGSLIGGLITRKKRKKINRQLQQEFRIQAAAQKEAQRVEQLRANFAVRQEKIQQLREARIRRGQVLASGVASGAGLGSTAIQGGISTIYSQAVGNVGQLNVFQGYSEAISKQNEIVAESQGRQAVLGAKMQTQEAKANLIGSAVDAGLSLATLPFGGVQGAATSIFRQ